MAKAKMPPDDPSATPAAGGVAPAFTSTGPAGHRKRMRQRVLTHGATGLADYELLEMLLFYGIPRRDTKPLAKSLINQFGSFAAVFESPVEQMRAAGMPSTTATLCAHVPVVANCLVQGSSANRPYLGDWDSLVRYCSTVLQKAEGAQSHILFLDSRNSLLVAEPFIWPEEAQIEQMTARLLQRALEVQACALVTVCLAEQEQDLPDLLQGCLSFISAVRKAAPLLAITLHDHLIIGQGKWLSARQKAGEW